METTLFILLLTVVSVAPEFATSNNIFTSSVYKEVIKTGEENILISPLSAEIALALALSGAKNETAEELRSCLHLPSNQKTESSFKSLLQNLKGKRDYALHTANKIYVGKNFSIKEGFKSTAASVYQSEVENIDFSQSEAAASRINRWVEKQTENKIKNLVDSTSISNTPAVIINTLYFKADWIDKDFHKYPIMKQDFYKTKTKIIKVDMMTHEASFYNYKEDTNLGATFLELPFQGGDAHMVFVLPHDRDGLGKIEAQSEKIFKTHQFSQELVEVTVPVFKIESSIDFKKILQQLGVRKTFVIGEADFSGIAGNKGDLAVGGVLQKTFINVNRDGVEAAAATNLWFYMSGPPEPKKVFVADHPFIFYIRVGDVILFVGRVVSPSQ